MLIQKMQAINKRECLKKERKKHISEWEVRTVITRGGEIQHKRHTYHVHVGSAPILKQRLFQLFLHRLGPVLRSLRYARPPSLILAGFSWRSASSLHRPFLSSAFNSSPLLRLFLKGGPLFLLKSYHHIGRFLGCSIGGRREHRVLVAYDSPWRLYSEHAPFQTYPAKKQKFIPDMRPLIWLRPEFNPPPKRCLKLPFSQMFHVMRFRLQWLI